MKRWLLASLVAALTAAPALAQTPSSHPSAVPAATLPSPQGGQTQPAHPAGGAKTTSVPDPGTLALASMGLLALGVAARRRRSG